MDLNAIIAAIKARCPSFEGRVAAAAEYAKLDESVKLGLPAAYVIPLDDEPEDQESSNGYHQVVRDVFSVIVVLSNVTDERGQASIITVYSLRAELFSGLLGWMPDQSHDRIEYRGGNILDVDRARLFYQFEFSADMQLKEEDTYQNVFNQALPAFTQLGISVDTIDPHDPNLVTVGPDGKIDVTLDIEVPQ